MDEEDAQGILLEWLGRMGAMIQSGIVEVGGEMSTDLTSVSGADYRVEIVSVPTEDGQALMTGRIHPQGTPSPVLSIEAELELPAGLPGEDK